MWVPETRSLDGLLNWIQFSIKIHPHLVKNPTGTGWGQSMDSPLLARVNLFCPEQDVPFFLATDDPDVEERMKSRCLDQGASKKLVPPRVRLSITYKYHPNMITFRSVSLVFHFQPIGQATHVQS